MNNKKAQIAIIALFLVFTVGLSVLFFAVPHQEYSGTEKRYLAKLPEISLQSFLSGELTTSLEGSENGGYIPDHFPFRTFFVGVNSYFNLLTGTTADNGYYLSHDGYIITKPASSERARKNLELINRFASSFDEVTLLVIPSPGYIMGSLLPLNHTEYPDGDVYSYIESSHNGNVKVALVNDRFDSAFRDGTQLYYRTDHHWTTEGAYLAYQNLSDVLGYTATEKSRFSVSRYAGFYGTTYSSSGYFLSNPDTLEIWEDKSLEGKVTVTVTEGKKSDEYNSLYFREHLSEDDMYPVFLDGNHALVTIENENAELDRTLVIVKDSYAHCITPFLTKNYSKIVMVDLRYYKMPVSKLVSDKSSTDILFLYGMNNFCTDTNLAYLD